MTRIDKSDKTISNFQTMIDVRCRGQESGEVYVLKLCAGRIDDFI